MLRPLLCAAVLSFGGTTLFAQDCVPIGQTCVTEDDSRVILEGADLSEMSELAKTPWITDVRLIGPIPEGMTLDLGALQAAAGLRSLWLQDLRGADFSALPRDGITGIVLRSNGLTDLSFLQGFDDLIALQVDEDLALKDVPDQIAAQIQYLYPAGRTRLDGGAAFSGVTILSLFDRTHPDLAGLGLLPALERLTIRDGAVESLDGLVPGPNLIAVEAEGTPLRDISALSDAVNLERLGAKNTQLTSIAALARKPKLRDVSVTNTQVSDLSPLRGADRLALLGISGTPVTDISPLAGLPELVGLYMNVTRVTDFTPLLQNRRDLILRINSDRITTVNSLEAFIAEEGWKRGPLYD